MSMACRGRCSWPRRCTATTWCSAPRGRWSVPRNCRSPTPAKPAFHSDDTGRLRPMRLVTFRYPSKLGTHIGALREDGVVLDLAAADPALAGGHMPSFIAGGAAALQHAKAAV